MISGQECRTYSADCEMLGRNLAISIQRATILLAMSRSGSALATQTDRYDAIVKEEDNRGRLGWRRPGLARPALLSSGSRLNCADWVSGRRRFFPNR